MTCIQLEVEVNVFIQLKILSKAFKMLELIKYEVAHKKNLQAWSDKASAPGNASLVHSKMYSSFKIHL